jgi:L-fucose isomerase-like protein
LARFYGRHLDRMHLVSGELRSTGEYWGGTQLEVHSNGDAGKFLDHISGNHYLLTYGDIRPELRLFAEWNHLEVIDD